MKKKEKLSPSGKTKQEILDKIEQCLDEIEMFKADIQATEAQIVELEIELDRLL